MVYLATNPVDNKWPPSTEGFEIFSNIPRNIVLSSVLRAIPINCVINWKTTSLDSQRPGNPYVAVHKLNISFVCFWCARRVRWTGLWILSRNLYRRETRAWSIAGKSIQGSGGDSRAVAMKTDGCELPGNRRSIDWRTSAACGVWWCGRVRPGHEEYDFDERRKMKIYRSSDLFDETTVVCFENIVRNAFSELGNCATTRRENHVGLVNLS